MSRTSGWLLVLGLILAVTNAHGEEGDVQAGRQLYTAKLCNLCHTLAGEMGQLAHLGGPLDQLGTRRDASWLRGYLKSPTSVLPEAKMPRFELTDREITDLITYLLSL